MPVPTKLLMGFDYCGAGNIGDDLMIGGFLRALERLGLADRMELFSFCYGDPASQRRRFPQVNWIDRRERENWINNPVLRGVDCWAGVADTPMQATGGMWLIDRMFADLPHLPRFAQKLLISVGAETEALPLRARLGRIVEMFERISTRDEMSLGVFHGLGANPSRCRAGADLAHLTLQEIAGKAPAPPAREFDLGIIVAGDTLSAPDVDVIGDFILQAPARVAFIANETRLQKNFERGIHARLVERHGRRMLDAAELIVPDYEQDSVAHLAAPVSRCRVVLSSRYHGALAAAWMGCDLGIIARSSKVLAAATDLQVPFISPPLSLAGLQGLLAQAIPVRPRVLADLAEKAVEGVAFAFAD
jgi:hypothetical protein